MSSGRVRENLHAARTEFASIIAIPDLGRYWFGQLVSSVGSGATAFVLAAYIYLETRSLVQFAFLFALNLVPSVLLSPAAGVLVDRYDRRLLHIIGDGGIAVVTLAAIGLWSTNGLTVGAVYVLVVAAAVFEVLQGAAAESMYQQLVPPNKLVRVGAIMGPVEQTVEVIAPAIGITLLASAGLGAVFIFDLVTFGVAVFMLTRLTNPEAFRLHMSAVDDADTPPQDEDHEEDEIGYRKFLGEGNKFLRENAGMNFIFQYSIVDSVLSTLIMLTMTVAALEMGGERLLAIVQGAVGIGTIGGMILVAVFGLRRTHVITANVVGPGMAIGVVLIIAAIAGHPMVLAAAGLLVWLLSAPMDSSMEATFYAATPKPLIGRVSAVFDTSMALASLILLLSAPLIEWVLAPALEGRILRVGSLGQIAGGEGPLVPLLCSLGMAGVGFIGLSLWARWTPARHAADDLGESIETAPLVRLRTEDG